MSSNPLMTTNSSKIFKMHSHPHGQAINDCLAFSHNRARVALARFDRDISKERFDIFFF